MRPPPNKRGFSSPSAPSATLRALGEAGNSRKRRGGQREGLSRPERVALSAEDSAVRDRLMADLERLQTRDEAAEWVHRNLAHKHTLSDRDADLVEACFRVKLFSLEPPPGESEETHQPVRDERAEMTAAAQEDQASRQAENAIDGFAEQAAAIPAPIAWVDPAPIVLPAAGRARARRLAAKTNRLRDKQHCVYVSTQPCVVCGRIPSEAHHIRFAQPRALGRKVSDDYTVPVCRLHHREIHRYGDEASWLARVNVDPVPFALELWRRSHS